MPKATAAPDLTIQINIAAPEMKALAEALTGMIQIQRGVVDSTTAPIARVQEAPVQTTPAPTAPVQATPAPTAPPVTLDAICNAGARLVDEGRIGQVMQLLEKYGVQAVNQVKEEQLAAFANDLRALGAQI